MWKRFTPIVLAVLALSAAAVMDLIGRPLPDAIDGGPVPYITQTEAPATTLHLADGSTFTAAPAGDEMFAIALKIIPNPFAMPTLFAQPAAASVKLTAPYRVTMGVAAAQITASGNVNGGVCLKALVPGQTLYLGVSSAVTTATGWPMSDNESLCLGVRNANELYGIASAAAQSVAVLPFSRY